MRNEAFRYAAVSAQIEQLTKDAANDRDPATAILRAQLVSELIDRNERAHARYEARTGIIQALQWRIQGMQRLLAMVGITPEELSAVSEALLNMAQPEEA